MPEFIEIRDVWDLVRRNTTNSKATADDFITYLEDNNWFGIEPAIIWDEGAVMINIPTDNIEDIINKATGFMNRLALPEKKRLDYLFEQLAQHYPDTAETLQNYVKEKHIALFHAMQITDFLICFLDKEVYTYNNAELEILLYQFSQEMSKATGITFANYLNWLIDNRLTRYKKISMVKTNKSNVNRTKYAYDIDTYIKLFYVLFSEASIEDNSFYELIADNEKSAVSLLFLSLHMICALRDEDIKRLPHPKLMTTPQDVLNAIRNHSLSDTDAIIATEKILREIEFLQPKPNKTSDYNNIPYIKLFIPESLKVHFGYLFSAAEAHFQLNADKRKQYYIYPITTYDEFQKYLGEDVAEIFWDSDYSTRAFNKTYMQLSQQYFDCDLNGNTLETNRPIGYMFAAFARSHKASYGEFAATTAIYLKDRKLSGYSTEYIVKELTERGVCSFIVTELLEILYDKDFKRLSMKEQTKLIKEFGLNPYEIESSIIAYETALDSASNAVSEILQVPAKERRNVVTHMLDNIINNTAVSKQKHIDCFMTAMGKDCPFPERKQCAGCTYKIFTKSAIYTLTAEYQKNKELLMKASTPQLKSKYKQLLKTVIVPSIQEILVCVQETEGEEHAKELMQIVREVISNDK